VGDAFSPGRGALPPRACDAARHAADLVARDRVWLNVDLAQHGLGSGACGPAVLPQYRLAARPASFAFALRPLGR
jgi:beta-galactosidase